MTILGIMQNQWLKNAEQHQRLFDSMKERDVEQWWRLRERAIPFALFRGCHSGKILKSALGTGCIERMIWEEASTVIADNPKACPPADPEHIRDMVIKYHPSVIVTFGVIARDGWLAASTTEIKPRYFPHVYHAPHPACRSPKDRAAFLSVCATIRDL